jgi:hypothetical protein
MLDEDESDSAEVSAQGRVQLFVLAAGGVQEVEELVYYFVVEDVDEFLFWLFFETVLCYFHRHLLFAVVFLLCGHSVVLRRSQNRFVI